MKSIPFSRLQFSKGLLWTAAAMSVVAYLLPWEKYNGGWLYGWERWREALSMAQAVHEGDFSITVLRGTFMLLGILVQILAVPFLIPVVRSLSLLRWALCAFALYIAIIRICFLHYSFIFMAVGDYSMVGPGRWMEVAAYALHAIGMVILPRMKRTAPTY